MFKIFKEAPKSIKMSFALISFSILISVLVWELKASNFDFGSRSRSAVAVSGLVIGIIVFVINYMILKKKNWARIMLTLIAVLTTFFYI
jgi:hypothetical protein